MGLTRPRFHQLKESDYKNSCRVVTTADVTLSGGTPATVDGVNLQVNDRVLVTGQTTASQNGIYFVSTLGSGNNGTWTRATDANENAEVTSGLIVNVDEGTVYADTTWKLTTNDPIIVGTTELTFVTNLNVGKIIASPASTSVGNTATSIDTFSTSAYRGAKYLITISNSGNHDIIEALLVHDGTTATVTVYGETSTNASLGDITADINSGNVRLLYTGVSAGNSVKLAATYISS